MSLDHPPRKISQQRGGLSCLTYKRIKQHKIPADEVPDEVWLRHCFQLRHRYFVRERGWVSETAETPGLERDRYDPHAFHLAVYQGEEVAAYLRILPFDPAVGFMLDHELSAILSLQERAALPREGAVELSRFVCRSGCLKSGHGNDHPVELLFRQLYQLSLERGFTRYYIVVEADWLRPFARRFGLPFQVVGQPYLFPDGTKTVAATATVRELEVGLQRYSESKLLWYGAKDEEGENEDSNNDKGRNEDG